VTLSIQDENFLTDFKIGTGIVGQVGHGFIGQAVESLFKPHVAEVLVYDKAKPGLNTLEEVVSKAQVIFVAVPTPMNKDGSCHTGIVESVLQDIQNAGASVKRDLEDFVVVIKSTVPPGFTARMQDKFALRIVFSPEFLTEANANDDFKRINRVVLGGDRDDCAVVYKFFEGVWPDRMPENYEGHPDGPCVVVWCDTSTVAEMVKYFTNGILTVKVMFANEMYQLCQRLGVDYEDVREVACLDQRIGHSHTKVPGPDGSLGFGGSCFPKDINSLRAICAELGLPERLFSATVLRNEELRPSKDWEQLKGRAVVD
jgi:nucleotide sugar dehydrogenase